MTTAYGPLRRLVPAPVTRVVQSRPLYVLPSLDAPTPRRRRTIVCSHLVCDAGGIDTTDTQSIAGDFVRGGLRSIKLKLDALRCTVRGTGIRPDYAIDVCLSSWCRQCPFVDGND